MKKKPFTLPSIVYHQLEPILVPRLNSHGSPPRARAGAQRTPEFITSQAPRESQRTWPPLSSRAVEQTSSTADRATVGTKKHLMLMWYNKMGGRFEIRCYTHEHRDVGHRHVGIVRAADRHVPSEDHRTLRDVRYRAVRVPRDVLVLQYLSEIRRWDVRVLLTLNIFINYI